jgi:hypothetical protein
MRRSLTALVAAAVVAFAVPATARAEEQHAAGGAVAATLSFSFDRSTYRYSDLRLVITRAGQPLYDADPSVARCAGGCWPGGFKGRRSVHVRDLDGDGEPEVVVDLFTGGAHCCSVAEIYAFDGTGYRSISHDFGDPGYRIGPIGAGATPKFVSGDPRFAYRFTAFAFSLFPVQIWSYRGGRLHDVTPRYRGRIRADARRSWRLYRRFLHSREGYEPRGAVAAWAADEYRLGRRAATLHRLRRLALRGQLPGSFPTSPLRFVRVLDRFLRRHGY